MPSTGDSGSTDRHDARWAGAFDVALGLSALGWSIRGLSAHPLEPVAWALALLNATAGVLFTIRRPAEQSGSTADALLCLASLPIGGFALALAPPLGDWHPAAEMAFVAGAMGAVVSLLALGKSFGVLPAVRSTVAIGPYRFLRHPAYAAELVMVAACSLASSHPLRLLPLLVGVALVSARILAEERLLSSGESYRAYRERVRWRLLPGLW